MNFQKVTLAFPSLIQLWRFVTEVRMNYSDFNSSELTLVCDCQEGDIEMAKEKYNARFQIEFP